MYNGHSARRGRHVTAVLLPEKISVPNDINAEIDI